jgi:3-hydroxybutyryl-CoA dehydrogenase
MEIRKVGVLGCGLMGSGIAQTSAAAGFETVVREVSDELIQKGFAGIEKSLARFAEKGTITAAAQGEIRARLSGTTSFEALKDCDIIIEAIIENLDLKRDTYRQLDAICKPETIFASNTSSISITEMMTATSAERQRRFIGMHFFNPVPIMKLVEVVRTILTDEAVYEQAVEFGKRLGKVPVRAGDKTGFIVNRLLVPYMLDAVRALEEGVGSIVDIDNAMKLGCGYPMGPFTLGDFVGLDTTYYIAEIMFNEFREKRFAPPPLLKRMVLAGLYGRKSGRGFYDYTKDPKNPTPMALIQ